MSIQELAKEAREHFVLKDRRDGDTFWTVKQDAPKWVLDLCFRAHDDGDLLPDDWRYRFIVEALDALSKCDDPYDAQVAADIYVSDLLTWVSSHRSRMKWVDRAAKLQRWHGLAIALQNGQAMERDHVLGLVRGFLEGLKENGSA